MTELSQHNSKSRSIVQPSRNSKRAHGCHSRNRGYLVFSCRSNCLTCRSLADKLWLGGWPFFLFEWCQQFMPGSQATTLCCPFTLRWGQSYSLLNTFSRAHGVNLTIVQNWD
jgi:hypothetical protein